MISFMPKVPDYKNEELSFEARAKDLVAQMTLEEKASQTVYNSAAIPRLGIPAYNWWNEALHGVARAGVATSFPQAIGMAATFDEDLLEKTSEIISTEGRAKFHEFQKKGDYDIYKGLTFGPLTLIFLEIPGGGEVMRLMAKIHI
jgi:beta-glucosidase